MGTDPDDYADHYSVGSVNCTAKFGPFARRSHNTTCSEDSEALRYGPALQALLTDGDVVKDLSG
jgi:hypothetical protein